MEISITSEAAAVVLLSPLAAVADISAAMGLELQLGLGLGLGIPAFIILVTVVIACIVSDTGACSYKQISIVDFL